MRLNDDNKTVAAVDLLVPGAGELMGGSQREERLEVMKKIMKEKNIPYELHIYQKGVHGVSLGDSRTSRKPNQSNKQAASWVELVMGWLG